MLHEQNWVHLRELYIIYDVPEVAIIAQNGQTCEAILYKSVLCISLDRLHDTLSVYYIYYIN